MIKSLGIAFGAFCFLIGCQSQVGEQPLSGPLPDVQLVIDAKSESGLDQLVHRLISETDYVLHDTQTNLNGSTDYLLGNGRFELLILPDPFCPSPEAGMFYVDVSLTADPPGRVDEGLELEGERLRRVLLRAVVEKEEQIQCPE